MNNTKQDPKESTKTLTYIVEHLDPELESWSALEYRSIAQESRLANSSFLLSSVPPSFQLPPELKDAEAQGLSLQIEHRSVEELFEGRKGEVCLLDPKAERELQPADGNVFGAFLFGGILGDDPPLDRTSVLRSKGFERRRLGPVQMTTDTAVRVTRMVVQEGFRLEDIPYVDQPEIKVSVNESTVMPFRYVKDAKGEPVMPEGMRVIIVKDGEKGFEF